MCVYTYIYIYRERERYIYVYMYIYLVRHGNRQDVFYGFRRRHHPTLFMVSVVGFSMVSVVAGNICLWFPSLVFVNGFRRGRKTLLMVSVAVFFVDSAAAGGSRILERIERFLVFCCVLLGLVSVAGFLMVSGRRTLLMVSVVGLFYGFRRRGKER